MPHLKSKCSASKRDGLDRRRLGSRAPAAIAGDESLLEVLPKWGDYFADAEHYGDRLMNFMESDRFLSFISRDVSNATCRGVITQDLSGTLYALSTFYPEARQGKFSERVSQIMSRILLGQIIHDPVQFLAEARYSNAGAGKILQQLAQFCSRSKLGNGQRDGRV